MIKPAAISPDRVHYIVVAVAFWLLLTDLLNPFLAFSQQSEIFITPVQWKAGPWPPHQVELVVERSFEQLAVVTEVLEEDDEVDFLSDDYFEEEEHLDTVADPLEPVNRVIFAANDYLYTGVIEPVATGYSYIVPEDLRGCLGNFFNHLGEPLRFVNALLQGRVEDAGRVVSRFLINSTVGVFGLVDASAHEFDLPPVEASFGETFEAWGIGDGFYLVLPLLGPSTAREAGGELLEGIAMAPYYSWAEGWSERIAVYSTEKVNQVSLHLGDYEALKALTFDPYIAFRNGYFQYRDNLRKKKYDSE